MNQEEPNPAEFATTLWTVVLTSRKADSAEGRAALEELCRRYYLPVYSFIRRKGNDPSEAEDLTQSFFLHVLEKGALSSADPEKGRFRALIATMLRHFLTDQHRRAVAQKRGGGQRACSLDVEEAERHYRMEPADRLTAETIYERRWAMALMNRAWNRLREEYVAAGKEEIFEVLRGFHTDDATTLSYAEAGQRLQMREGAIKTKVYRLRRRYRALIRDEVAQTVSSPDQVEAEIRHLLVVLGG